MDLLQDFLVVALKCGEQGTITINDDEAEFLLSHEHGFQWSELEFAITVIDL